jgi:hypothetical protein
MRGKNGDADHAGTEVNGPLHLEWRCKLCELLGKRAASKRSRVKIDEHPHKKALFDRIGVLLAMDDIEASLKEKRPD